MAALRASTASIKDAAAGIPTFSVDSGYVEGALVDATTNSGAMSPDVSPFLLNSPGGEGKINFCAWPNTSAPAGDRGGRQAGGRGIPSKRVYIDKPLMTKANCAEYLD